MSQAQEKELNAREMDVLTLFAIGMLRHDIADVLQISETTLRVHLTRIYAKLGVDKLHQAVVWFFANQYNVVADKKKLRTVGQPESK